MANAKQPSWKDDPLLLEDICNSHIVFCRTTYLPTLQVPEGSRVRFRLSDGEFPCSYGCQSYVEIKHKMDVRLTGFRSCCYRPKEDTVSEGNQIFVIYHPNGRSARFSLRFVRQP
uniref:CUB domain-containing protein n=1 Tax=Steinernema glaseri TaxID=37863 RepID=A0A1I8AC99_9BILA